MNAQWLTYFENYAEKLFPAFAAPDTWNYKDDICMVGEEMLWQVTGSEIYRRSMLKCGEALCTPEGRLRHWDDDVHNLDFVSLGKSLWVLYRLTGRRSAISTAGPRISRTSSISSGRCARIIT